MDAHRIYLSPPDIGQVEKSHLLAAFDSPWVGPDSATVSEFEDLLRQKSNREFAVALSSGTAALHLGLLSLGVGINDYVICSTLTFVATANAIRYTGATPVFVDSEPHTGNISPLLLERAIRRLQKSNKRIGAVIPVDFLGCVADYASILPLCLEYGIPVLADSAESLGAVSDGNPAGSFGEAAAFSFNLNKIVTASGGGALVTDNSDIATKGRFLSKQARESVRHYEHIELGFNYRLSNLSAAVGIGQMTRLDQMTGSRRATRGRYKSLMGGTRGISFLGREDSHDNCWLTAIVVDSSICGFSADDLALTFEAQNIETRPLWKPMHLQPMYSSEIAFSDGTSEKLFASGLTLPSGSGLSEEEWDRIEDTLIRFLGQI